MARLPETIRQRLLEIAKNNDGRVSIADVKSEFTLAGYGAGKMENWIQVWAGAGICTRHYIDSTRMYVDALSFQETKHLLKSSKTKPITAQEALELHLNGVRA